MAQARIEDMIDHRGFCEAFTERDDFSKNIADAEYQRRRMNFLTALRALAEYVGCDDFAQTGRGAVR